MSCTKSVFFIFLTLFFHFQDDEPKAKKAKVAEKVEEDEDDAPMIKKSGADAFNDSFKSRSPGGKFMTYSFTFFLYFI